MLGLGELFFDCPAKEFHLHGITGTNGKTTTAFLLEHILTENKLKTGLITTVECRDGEKIAPAEHTTPEAWELQSLFRRIADNKCHDAVMEVSSHGLDQFRPGSAKFHTAVFTNLTGDHLDYHKDMETYFSAKKHLFLHYLDGKRNRQSSIRMTSMEKCLPLNWIIKILSVTDRMKNADCRITGLFTSTSGTAFKLVFKNNTYEISSPLIGEYNAYNACAAFCAALASGIDGKSAADVLCGEIKVPGRIERFCDGRGVTYFVDYAHTDDALRNVLKNLRLIAPERIIPYSAAVATVTAVNGRGWPGRRRNIPTCS